MSRSELSSAFLAQHVATFPKSRYDTGNVDCFCFCGHMDGHFPTKEAAHLAWAEHVRTVAGLPIEPMPPDVADYSLLSSFSDWLLRQNVRVVGVDGADMIDRELRLLVEKFLDG